jgi:uncharacterized protein YciI
MKYYFFTLHKTVKRASVSDEFALETLHKHTAFFKRLGAEGTCLMAGPFINRDSDIGGGCYVFAAETEDEAKAIASADPLVAEGLYYFKVLEWMKVVPE